MRHLLLATSLFLPTLCLAAAPTTRSADQSASQAEAQTPPERIRLATWNIENWRDHFEADRLKQDRSQWSDEKRRMVRTEGWQNDEDNWEIAQTILDEGFLPDVLVFQEGASNREVQSFKDKWLDGKYNRHIVFPGNSERGQTLGVLLRPSITVVEVRDQFYLEADLAEDINPRSDRLFARGPAFVLLEAPGGYRFWVGTTHQKSKGGNDVVITRWRGMEAERTRQIMNQLRSEGVEDVFMLGDMNDEIGFQEFEQEGGGDVMARLVGDEDDGMVLATRDLAESGAITFTGYWRDRYRSFIDHIVMTEQAADQVLAVEVIDTPWAQVASDHAPVFIDIKPDPAE